MHLNSALGARDERVRVTLPGVRDVGGRVRFTETVDLLCVWLVEQAREWLWVVYLINCEM